MLARAWPGTEGPARSVEQMYAPGNGWVGHRGAAAPEAASPPKPLYLRPPDAQPQETSQLARR
jgi:hypothetical protein